MGFVDVDDRDDETAAATKPLHVRVTGIDGARKWQSDTARKMTVFANKNSALAKTLESVIAGQRRTTRLLASPALQEPISAESLLELPGGIGSDSISEMMDGIAEREERQDRAADAAVETAATVTELIEVTRSLAETSGQMTSLMAGEVARADRDARVQRIRHWVLAVLAAAAVAAPFVQAGL